MKKIFCYLLLLNILLSSFVVFANSNYSPNEDESMGIYFCTKDLHALESSSAKEDKYIKHGDIFVKRSLDNGYHTFLRHCFLIVGDTYKKRTLIVSPSVDKETNLNISSPSDSKNFREWLQLRIIDSAGYGLPVRGSKIGSIQSETWLYNKEELKKFTVSCAPILEENKLLKDRIKKIKKDDINVTQEVIDSVGKEVRKHIMNKWTDLKRTMDSNAAKGPYNLIYHNCCSVAYSSALKEGFDMVNIRKRNFNICGVGIWLDKYDEYWGIPSITTGFFNFISDTTYGSTQFAMNIFSATTDAAWSKFLSIFSSPQEADKDTLVAPSSNGGFVEINGKSSSDVNEYYDKFLMQCPNFEENFSPDNDVFRHRHQNVL